VPLARRDLLPDPVLDEIKPVNRYRESGELLHSQWHPVFRVDVSERPFFSGSAYLLSHDGLPGSAIHRFDGDLSSLDRLRRDPRSLPFAVAGPNPRVLVIGSAGGHELLAALYFGASRVVGVELNPVTVSLLTERYADFAGRIHEDPRVEVVNAEGRAFLRRRRDTWDLIWLVAPDSYASMNASSSAAFVLSESYLYTVEMIRECLGRLDSGGVLVAQFGERDFARKPNRTLRFLTTARRAFAAAGFEAFADHVMVLTAEGLPPLTEATILLSGRPFDARQRGRVSEVAQNVLGGEVRWPSSRALPGNPVRRVVTLAPEELDAWLDGHPYDLRPVFDDSPFFWHFTRFRRSFRSPISRAGDLDWEDTLGEQVVLALLLVSAVFAALWLGLPFLLIRHAWFRLPRKSISSVYFAGLGLGFMFVEVGLIQRFTLFLGYPTRSLSITLFALLLSSGAGSVASEGWQGRRDTALALLLAALAVLVGVHHFLVPSVFEQFAGAPLSVRALIAVLLIAPLGLCLGAFLPLGLRSVAELGVHQGEYVAWAWAVNGFFSVLGSISSTILAMLFGFDLLLSMALLVYAASVYSLRRFAAPAASPG
jgi:hypothetical protein